MYDFEFRKNLEKNLKKIAKKNPKIMLIVEKKIEEIIINPHHYKNLRKLLQNLKRVHVNKSFVLVFSVNEQEHKIIFEEFDHHDNIYK
jgi:YafQ family addiction module toxin component